LFESVKMKLKLAKFNIHQMKPNRICLLVGKRGTGKSTLMEDVMFWLRDSVCMGVAFTPTEESACMFRRHIPEPFIYNAYSSSAVESIIRTQRALCRKQKPKKILMALDDCMYDKKILKSVETREIFMNGRHLQLSILIACQYIMDLGPDLRTNVDYVFALRENIISNRQRLWRYFFGMFPKYEDFAAVMDACTNDYCCLVLDNTVKSNRVEDCMFWYRADSHLPSYSVGSRPFIALARQYRRNEGDHEEECETQTSKELRITHVSLLE
jgi:hypothetical protein